MACDRLQLLKQDADPHSLALVVVKLEEELARLTNRNTDLSRQVRELEQHATSVTQQLAQAELRAEQLEATVKDTATKLLELKLKREAAHAGITDPSAAAAYARVESPKRLRDATASFPSAGDAATPHAPPPGGGSPGWASIAPSLAKADPRDPTDPDDHVGDSRRELAALDTLVSTVVGDVEAGMGEDRAKLEHRLVQLEETLNVSNSQREDLEALLNIETDRRIEAEGAYKYLLDQTAPLRLGFSKAASSAKREVREHARALELNATACVQFAETVARDVESHFGYVPLALSNKIDALVRSVAIVPQALHSSSRS